MFLRFRIVGLAVGDLAATGLNSGVVREFVIVAGG